MNKPLLSFHGKQSIKDGYLNRLELHRQADEIVKGQYWQYGKGCAVGCTVHSDSHMAYETELGIPMILARLEDRIFEGMSNDKAKDFPIQFLSAIPVGVDLENVWRKMMILILTDADHGVIKFAKNDSTKSAIQNVSDAFGRSLTTIVERSEWIKLRDAAAYAADAAAYADAAADAADAAAYAATAAYAAYAADAAAAAAYAADAAYAAAYAADAERKYYDLMAEKLIQLLSEAK